MNVEYSMPSECGISDLAKQRDVRAGPIGAPLAMADRQRGPFAHAVGGQDRRARAWER